MSGVETKLLRREFLFRAGRILAGAAVAAAAGPNGWKAACARASSQSGEEPDQYDFLLTRVKFNCDSRVEVGDLWHAFPGGDRNLLEELRKVARCRVKIPQDCRNTQPRSGQDYHFNAIVDLTDMEQLRKYPFLFMTASGYFTLDKRRKENLHRYVNEGGFLLMDDCIHDNLDLFYQSSYKLLEEIFGKGAVQRVPARHEVFHNVYDLGDVGLPHVRGINHGARGVFVGDRLAVFLSSTDIHCGWAGWLGIGTELYKQSIQMGINIVMYAISH